jgi:hypothetical protein
VWLSFQQLESWSLELLLLLVERQDFEDRLVGLVSVLDSKQLANES